MGDKIRILVVDDHTVVRKGLCALLSADKYGIEVVGEAANGEEALEKTRQLDPQVILMDLIMPVMDGLEAIKAIRAELPEARILVMTSYTEDDMLVRAIEAGAMGYLLKDASPDVLVSTIQNVFLERMSLPTDMLRKVMGAEQGAQPEPSQDALTGREVDVLRCVGRGLSNKEIARELTVSTTTVRTHVSNLLRKLGMTNRTQLALYARERDLV